MGRWQREKGAAFERAIANLLKPLWPDARRGIGQARAANEVPDVDGTPWWIETKAHRQVSIQAAYRQGIDAAEGRRPVAVVSRDATGQLSSCLRKRLSRRPWQQR